MLFGLHEISSIVYLVLFETPLEKLMPTPIELKLKSEKESLFKPSRLLFMLELSFSLFSERGEQLGDFTFTSEYLEISWAKIE